MNEGHDMLNEIWAFDAGAFPDFSRTEFATMALNHYLTFLSDQEGMDMKYHLPTLRAITRSNDVVVEVGCGTVRAAFGFLAALGDKGRYLGTPTLP
jgi:hypothetical protein